MTATRTWLARAAAISLVLAGLLLANVPASRASDILPPLNEPPSKVSIAGKFTWFDLASPALQEQMDFYSSVFGWTYRSPGQTNEDYVLILNQGKPIGGMFRYQPPGGEQDGAVWVSLMSAPDPDEAARVVVANGGKVVTRPAHVPRRGRHALFQDPEGALFGVLKSDSGDPPDSEVAVGSFLWLDLFAREPQRMAEFYSALAPYSVEQRPVTANVNRELLSAHGMARAGIVPVDEEANRSAWVPYVRVADVEATLERAVAGGGFAIIAPDPAILDGNLAVFVDPNGAATGIVKWEYGQEGAE